MTNRGNNWYDKSRMGYFDVGHGGSGPFTLWALIKGRGIVVGPKYSKNRRTGDFEDRAGNIAKTHGGLWGYEEVKNVPKGRYEFSSGRLTVVIPPESRWERSDLAEKLAEMVKLAIGEDVDEVLFL